MFNLMAFSSTTLAKTKIVGGWYPELIEEKGEETAASPAAWLSLSVPCLELTYRYTDTSAQKGCSVMLIALRFALLKRGNDPYTFPNIDVRSKLVKR